MVVKLPGTAALPLPPACTGAHLPGLTFGKVFPHAYVHATGKDTHSFVKRGSRRWSSQEKLEIKKSA